MFYISQGDNTFTRLKLGSNIHVLKHITQKEIIMDYPLVVFVTSLAIISFIDLILTIFIINLYLTINTND